MNDFHKPNQPQIVTGIPMSLSTQIDQLNRLVSLGSEALNQGDPELAIVRAKHGLKVLQKLAENAPELSALLAASYQGHSGYMSETVEETEEVVQHDLIMLGIKVGSSVTRHPRSVRTTRQFRVI